MQHTVSMRSDGLPWVTQRGVLLAVAHTYQATSLSNTRIRIISARPVTKQEQHFYADEPR